MRRMIAYGFWKSWRTRRLFLLICAAAAALLLPLLKLAFVHRWDQAAGLCLPVLFLISAMLLVGPFIWGVTDYVRGISGRRGMLERSVAAPAWQKLLARLIVSLATIVALALLSVAIVAGAAAIAVSSYSFLGDMWRTFLHSPDHLPIGGFLLRGGAWGFLAVLFQTAKFLLLVWFAITLAKSFPGSRRAGLILTALVFVAFAVLSPMLAQLAAREPLHTFTLYTPPQQLQELARANFHGEVSSLTVSLTTVLINAAVMGLTFCATAWLAEHRVEN